MAADAKAQLPQLPEPPTLDANQLPLCSECYGKDGYRVGCDHCCCGFWCSNACKKKGARLHIPVCKLAQKVTPEMNDKSATLLAEVVQKSASQATKAQLQAWQKLIHIADDARDRCILAWQYQGPLADCRDEKLLAREVDAAVRILSVAGGPFTSPTFMVAFIPPPKDMPRVPKLAAGKVGLQMIFSSHILKKGDAVVRKAVLEFSCPL